MALKRCSSRHMRRCATPLKFDDSSALAKISRAEMQPTAM